MNSAKDNSDSTSGSPSKRFKGSEDQSLLPTGILKDGPFIEEEPAESSDRRKSRKSIGRRVSFAPTAHVRMFEIPEDKQAAMQGSNTFVMPDISSQTGMVGFNLGALSSIEEASMTSNESFDVSVRHSDPSESLQSSEGSFAAGTNQNNSTGLDAQPQSYTNMLEDDDSDDDSDENDMDEDAVTMELTGTVDMGAINSYGADDSDEEHQEADAPLVSSNAHTGTMDGSVGGGLFTNEVDASSFLNMLLQGNATTQHTSLLDNIMQQFETTQHTTTVGEPTLVTTDLDITRVGTAGDDDADVEMENTFYVQQNDAPTGGAGFGMDQDNNDNGDDDDDDDVEDENDNGYDDAVTMDLTGVVNWRPTEEDEAEEMSAESGEKAAGSADEMVVDTAEPETIGEAQTDTAIAAAAAAAAAVADFSEETRPVAQPVSPSIAPRTPRTPKTSQASGSQRPPQTPVSTMDLISILSSAITKTPEGRRSLENLQSQLGTPRVKSPRQATPAKRATPKRGSTPRTPEAQLQINNGDINTLLASIVAQTPLLAEMVSTPRAAIVSNQDELVSSAVDTEEQPENPNVQTPQLRKSAKSQETTPRGRTPRGRTPGGRTPGSARRTSRALAARDLDDQETDEEEPTFKLDPLPAPPAEPRQVPILPSFASKQPSLAELAKAGLVFDVFRVYQNSSMDVPELTAAAASLKEAPLRLEPLYRKAKLTARLDYCAALAGLFEADREVSRVADAELTDFAPFAEFFEEQSALLAQRKEELMVRISKARQRCSQEASAEEGNRLLGEIKELRGKLAEAKREREAAAAAAEALEAEIKQLQSTSMSAGRRATEQKGVQNILLAINGLQVSEVSEEGCEFVYDTFAKLHLDTAAEFTSLHPEIDWTAVIRDNIDASSMSTRQYSLAVMKANATLKELLEDVRRVKRMTFADLSYNGGIQVRMQLFSEKLRLRFYLNISLDSIEAYRRVQQPKDFAWSTEVVYGDVDSKKLSDCVNTAPIDPKKPLLSIYNHVEKSLCAF
ncbi:hypothetical protein GGI07_000760 [Coemansia sp. Benny D115]|nr:hypothetical protein GGI07_000760 [Coemansia sp. Benny D115]